MTKNKKSELPPFVPLNVRAFVECDPWERSAILALNFWHWWKGEEEGLGLEGIALLGKMSERTASKVLKTMKEKGWVESQRGYGKKGTYRLTIEEMPFREAFQYAENLMGQPCAKCVVDDAPDAGLILHLTQEHPAPDARLIDKIQDLEPKTKVQDLHGNLKSRTSKTSIFTDYFWAKFQTKYGQKPTPAVWVYAKAGKIADTLEPEELKRRVDHYFMATFLTAHPFEKFINSLDSWINPPKDFSKGAENGKRAYIQPDTDWEASDK